MILRFLIFSIFLVSLSGCKDSEPAKTKKKSWKKELNASEKTNLAEALKKQNVLISQFEVLLQAFKAEEELQVWVKNPQDEQFQLFKSYDFCRSSGSLGPKRKEGDRQIPEGVYHIDRFNPNSSYFLSLGLNYPNPSDKKRGHPNQPGSDIFIHGKCVTVGCIPITDEWIRELYFLAESAKTKGQEKIPVLIFPFKMSNKNFKKHLAVHPEQAGFWNELQPIYEAFEANRYLPSIQFDRNGAYRFSLQ